MTEPLLSDIYNDSGDRILDFDDTELINSNNNFDFNSFHDTKNIREKTNTDLMATYQGTIDRINNEKIVIQNHLNNKIIELQTQIVKMKNTLERSEMSKAEVEVEVTKINKEFRQFQRQHNLQSSDFEKTKLELTSNFKTLESDYINQISQLNTLNKMLQEQIGVEKCNSKTIQDTLNDKINQVTIKMREKDHDLHQYRCLQLELEKIIEDNQSNIIDLTQKIRESEENNSRNASIIIEKDGKIEGLILSENKLRGIIVDLNAKVNELESQHFEEKHELNDSRSYQNNLQSQILELQEGKIIHEKERKLLLESIGTCNRRIKELEESVINQTRIAANYREQIKKIESERESQENNISSINEEYQIKVEELESKLQVQSRVIEEVNDEISSSRENESVAVSNFTRTLEELEHYINESSGNFVSLDKPSPRNKLSIKVPLIHCQSQSKNPRVDVPEEVLKQSCDAEYRSAGKKIVKNIRQTILNFQERINTLETDRVEALNKLESQGNEMKNLKFQLRRHLTHQKLLESENSKKQEEIENLVLEVSKIKSATNVIKQENGKNISHLKQTLNKTCGEFQDDIETRDNYLQSISHIIKEALKNSLVVFRDKGNLQENQGDQFCVLPHDYRSANLKNPQNPIETSTQTSNFCDRKPGNDNVELTGNLVGTFRFLKENSTEITGVNDNLFEKRIRYHPDNNNVDRKCDLQVNNNVEDKKKSSMKRITKKSEKDADVYVDSCKSWPALREVISSELVTLLNKYDIQRAQCQQLISELSAKESLITRLLSNQNSNSAQANVAVESTSRYQQTNMIEQNITNKSPNKATSFNQSNILLKSSVDSKRKAKSVKVENAPPNLSKRCFKPENQKRAITTRKESKNSYGLTNKKAITTSPKYSLKMIGGRQTPKVTIGALTLDASTLCAEKPTATLPQNTQPATSRSPETVDHCPDSNNHCDSDSRSFPLFVGIVLRLIHTRFRLQAAEEFIQYYKLCYHRSIECAAIDSINIDLESMIKRSGAVDSHVKSTIPKFRKFKVIVHVILTCRYMSRKLLATKLIQQIPFSDSKSVDFQKFLEISIDQNSNENCSLTHIDFIVEQFSLFCLSNNCQGILVDERKNKSHIKNDEPSPRNAALGCLIKTIDTLKSVFASQVSKVQYKSKQRYYQMNIKNLMIKIREMGNIIDDQNTVIDIREQDSKRLRELLNAEYSEKNRLANVISENKTALQNELIDLGNNKLILSKAKTYISGMINICEMCIKEDFFNFKELMKEEESIYRSLESTDSDDLLESVRDGVRVALRLSSLVKTIIM